MKKQTDNSPKPKKIPRKITTQEPPKVVEKEPEQSQQIEVDICTNRFIVETDAFDAYAVNSFALPKMLFTQQKLILNQKLNLFPLMDDLHLTQHDHRELL